METSDAELAPCGCGIVFHNLAINVHVKLHLPHCSLSDQIQFTTNTGYPEAEESPSVHPLVTGEITQNHLKLKNQTFICQICQKLFFRATSLGYHLKAHGIEKSFSCEECKSGFINENQLLTHIKTSHQTEKAEEKLRKARGYPLQVDAYGNKIPLGNRVYQCRTCCKVFLTFKERKSHYRKHARPVPTVCDKCGVEFPNQHDLKAHIYKVHLQRELYTCTICHKHLSRPDVLESHYATHFKPLECRQCFKSFSDKSKLEAHRLKHNSKRIQCPLCGISLSQHSSLKSHLKTHQPPEHQCPKCDKQYTQENSLRLHLQKFHGESVQFVPLDKPYSCDKCDKKFCRPSNLAKHVHLHSEDYLHQCKLCGKCFTRNVNLNMHMKTHDNSKGCFRCVHCKKGFTRVKNLNAHLRSVHSGKLSNTCEHCGEGFVFKFALVRHLRSEHTDLKLYACDKCEKKFRLPGYLTSHQHVHKGVRQHQCKKCEKSFTHLTGLKRHRRCVHAQNRQNGKQQNGKQQNGKLLNKSF